MKHLRLLLHLAFFCANIQLAIAVVAPDTRETTANSILTALFQKNGDLNQKQPKLVLTDENKKVATFNPSKNLIQLDAKAYQICQSFGADSSAALAYLIGHELAHKFQTDVKHGKSPTNFLSYDQHIHSDIRTERVADIQGAFNAWLCGYEVQKVVPGLIDQIYEAYELKGRNIPGYPTLAQRQAVATEVIELVDQLIDLYEGAGYLFAMGNYEMATPAYTHILSYYQGREVYNNLGVTYARAAMEYYYKTTDRFIYPLELDWSSALRKSKAARGEIAFGSPEYLLRMHLLTQAEGHVRKAIQLDPKYLPGHINLVCVLNLQGRSKEANDWLKYKLPSRQKSKQDQRIQMLSGITSALSGNQLSAQSLMVGITKSADPILALQAEYNVKIVQGVNPEQGAAAEFKLPGAVIQQLKALEMSSLRNLPKMMLNGGTGAYFISKPDASDTKTFSFGDQNGAVMSFKRKKNRSLSALSLFEREINLNREGFEQIITTPLGYYLVSVPDLAILKLDQNGKILEILRVIKHR